MQGIPNAVQGKRYAITGKKLCYSGKTLKVIKHKHMPKKPSEIKPVLADGDNVPQNNTGVIHNLVPNSNNTVQPVAMMRLGVFVPTLKSTARSKKNSSTGIDASGELTRLQFAKSEGYTNIRIVGPRLDMDTDFKTWIGIVRAFHKYKNTSELIKLKFSEFAVLCGYPSKRLDKALRTRLAESLLKVTATTLSFSDSEMKRQYNTHLVQKSYYNETENVVVLQKDSSLDDLYRIDHTVLLHLRVIRELPRRETAQALYTFLESLPTSPAPVSFKRMRDRLNLTASVDSQNQTIRKALKHLREVGYLDFTEFKQGRVPKIMIHSRMPKLGKVLEGEDPVEEEEGEE